MNNTTLNLNNVGSTSNINLWSIPERVDVIENSDSIEFVYKETTMSSYTSLTVLSPQVRVFKIVFSCVDGKWNKSERIYGQIVPAENEQYVF